MSEVAGEFEWKQDSPYGWSHASGWTIERYADQSGSLPAQIPDEEIVAVWEWHLSDEARPCFYSRASRSLRLLTGPRCRAEVEAENPADSGW
jgi:hypothetical protein